MCNELAFNRMCLTYKSHIVGSTFKHQKNTIVGKCNWIRSGVNVMQQQFIHEFAVDKSNEDKFSVSSPQTGTICSRKSWVENLHVVHCVIRKSTIFRISMGRANDRKARGVLWRHGLSTDCKICQQMHFVLRNQKPHNNFSSFVNGWSRTTSRLCVPLNQMRKEQKLSCHSAFEPDDISEHFLN